VFAAPIFLNSLTADQPPNTPGKLPSLRPEGAIWKLGGDLADTDLFEHRIFCGTNQSTVMNSYFSTQVKPVRPEVLGGASYPESAKKVLMIQRYSDHATNERIFAHWRAPWSPVAFGFVVEKFNLFLQSLLNTLSLDPMGQVDRSLKHCPDHPPTAGPRLE
jgi:hypothetical protein